MSPIEKPHTFEEIGKHLDHTSPIDTETMKLFTEKEIQRMHHNVDQLLANLRQRMQAKQA